jgi:hypothetical protein
MSGGEVVLEKVTLPHCFHKYQFLLDIFTRAHGQKPGSRFLAYPDRRKCLKTNGRGERI